MDLGTFTPNGWTPPAAPMPESEWLAALHQVINHHDSRQWQLGDLWAFGDHTYGNRKALAEGPEWRGPSYQTCRHAAVVAGAFEVCRRRHSLTFKHHAEVVALPKAVADEMLDWAVHEKRSTRELRARVHCWKQNPAQVDIEQRVEEFIGRAALAEKTKAKLRRVLKMAPDLAARVVAGELKTETAFTAARDRQLEREAAINAERDAAIAARRAAPAGSAVVIPIRRTAEEEQQHRRDAAEDLLHAARALRKVTNANVSAEALMHVLSQEQRSEIEAHLRTGSRFIRNVLTTWTINRSNDDEHNTPASDGRG